MVKVELSTKVLRALETVEKNRTDYTSLMNLYTNITKNKTISDVEREFLTQQVEVVLRTSFPKESGKSLGNKNDKPVEILEEIQHEIESKFDLSDNLHKNGVKVGGSMIGGREYISWYISYKNRQGWGTSLAYRQTTPEDDPRMEVRLYQVGSDGEHDEKHDFRLGDLSEAKEDYLSCLSLVDCPS